MTAFNEEQVAALRAPLSRENVKTREQSGRKLSYIEGWVAISEANRIFGFEGWNRETVECRVVCERERKIGQQQRDGWSVSYVAKVRVTVGDVVREGTGYGSGIDVDLGAAHESAIKEAETDAMKRALITFGNPFGLALYDKTQSEVEPMARPLSAERAANVKAATSTEPSHTRSASGNGPDEQRIRNIITKLDSIIKTSEDPMELAARWNRELDEFKIVEGAGEKGRIAADALRAKYNTAMNRMEDIPL